MSTLRFGQVLRQNYKTAGSVADRVVREHTEAFAENWRSRFGNEGLIADSSGVPGTAQPLSEPYHSKKIAKHGGADPGMLADSEALKNGVNVTMMKFRRRGFYSERAQAVVMDSPMTKQGYPIFALHEFGLGNNPPRMTLEPTRREVAEGFLADLHKEYAKKFRMRGTP